MALPLKLEFGGDAGNYRWSQTTTDIEIQVPFPRGIRGRDLELKIGKHHLLVKRKGAEDAIIDGELYQEIRTEDSHWTMEPEDHTVVIFLHKYHTREWDSQLSADKTWWRSIVKGGPENPSEHPPSDYYMRKEVV